MPVLAVQVSWIASARLLGMERVSLADACVPGTWAEVYPATPIAETSRRYVGMDGPDFESFRPSVSPECAVAVLSDPVVLDRHGQVFTEAGDFVEDTSWYRHRRPGGPLPEVLPEAQALEERCVLLASEWAGENFGHFLVDLLPRLEYLERSGLLRDDDTWLVPRLDITETRTLFRRTGIDPARVVWLEPGSCVTAPEVVVATFPGRAFAHSASTVEYLRARFMERPDDDAPTHLYLTRAGHSRAPANEDEVVRLVRAHGYEVLDCATRPGCARFANARVILGANGAALANCVFAPPDATVVELSPSDHAFPHFLDLACAAGLDFVGIGCRSLGHREPGRLGPSMHDFDVDLEMLRGVLAEL
jgi:capsular polysaccharide biosynthesis protein